MDGTVKWIVLALFFLALSGHLSAAEGILRPFLTDGCTGYPEGTQDEPTLWHHCCVFHDLEFWAGGELRDRKFMDLRLRDCVASTGEVHHAKLIYIGVRVGSHSPVKKAGMQWGNAWDAKKTRVTSLAASEIDLIENEISKLAYDPLLTSEERRDFILQLRNRPVGPR